MSFDSLIVITQKDLRSLIGQEVRNALAEYKINSPPIEDELLTVLETARLVKMSVDGLRKHKTLLPAIRKHRYVRYRSSDVRAFIAGKENK